MKLEVGDRVAVYAGDRKTGKIVGIIDDQTYSVSLDLYNSVPIYHVKQLRKLKSSTVYYYMFQDVRGTLSIFLDRGQAMAIKPPGNNLIVLKKVKEI